MYANNRWCGIALAVALAAPAVRADMITPDSIANPPPAVGSANGTLVYDNNIVNTQYASLGLEMTGPAITGINGVSAWVPVGPTGGAPGEIDYVKTLIW